MPKKEPIGLFQTVAEVLEQVQAPIAMDEVVQRVLKQSPSRAKNPVLSIRNHLLTEQMGRTLVFWDRDTVVPLHVAMSGVRFRASLCPEEVDHGVLLIYPAFHCLRPQGLELQDLQFRDATGEPVTTRAAVVQLADGGLVGPSRDELPVFELGDWFRRHRVRRDDSILITIEDWTQGAYRLEHEAADQRRASDIERQNRELADALFDLLEAAPDERMLIQLAIPTAYSRLSDARGYPGDPWREVIEADDRMSCDSFTIFYSDSNVDSLLAMILGSRSGARRLSPAPIHDPEWERQVYRLKASLVHRPGLWRRVEVRGSQTLADLDAILRRAFQHDRSEHLGGLWKRVRRGASQRFREIKLGTIDPWGEGEGAVWRMAELGLKPGDQLTYVYDFGDWIEHRLTLEATDEPEAEETYPRVVDQNKVRDRYCQACKGKQRKTVATWLCIACSERRQQKVLVCEACLTAAHASHYATEVVH
jgi:hypothetical protein